VFCSGTEQVLSPRREKPLPQGLYDFIALS